MIWAIQACSCDVLYWSYPQQLRSISNLFPFSLLKVVNSSCFPAEMPVNQGFWAIINLFYVTFLPKTSHPAFALELHRYSATHLVDKSTLVFRCNPKNHSDTKQAAEDDMHKITPCILFMLSELSIFSLLRNRSHWFCACLVQHCLWFILYENRIIFVRNLYKSQEENRW